MPRKKARIAALFVSLALMLTGCQVPGDTLFVRSQDADMPLLVKGNTGSKRLILVLHGGPGGTAIPFSNLSAFKELEKDYGVAYWDQRGAGDAQGNATPASLTLDQHVKDLDLVVEVLKKRYAGSQVFLMGHSWGGTLGTAYLLDPARQAKIRAWVAVDGSFDMSESNRLSREWALKRAQERIDQGKDVEKAKESLAWYQQTPEITKANFFKHYEHVSRLGAYLYDPAKAEQLDKMGLLFFSPHSVLSELGNFTYTAGNMSLDILLDTNLIPEMDKVKLPSLILNGKQDGMIPPAIAQAGFDGLGTATGDKAIRIFEDSAHRPMFEEPTAFAGAVKGFLAKY